MYGADDPREPRGAPLGQAAGTNGGGNPGWLSEVELTEIRRRMPIIYVEAVPVRTDGMGVVVQVGILLRATPIGEISRTIVSGRVRYGETVRDALVSPLAEDLGPMAGSEEDRDGTGGDRMWRSRVGRWA